MRFLITFVVLICNFSIEARSSSLEDSVINKILRQALIESFKDSSSNPSLVCKYQDYAVYSCNMTTNDKFVYDIYMYMLKSNNQWELDTIVMWNPTFLIKESVVDVKKLSVLYTLKELQLLSYSDFELEGYFTKQKNTFDSIVAFYKDSAINNSFCAELDFFRGAKVIVSEEGISIELASILNNSIGFFYPNRKSWIEIISPSWIILLKELDNNWYLYRSNAPLGSPSGGCHH